MKNLKYDLLIIIYNYCVNIEVKKTEIIIRIKNITIII